MIQSVLQFALFSCKNFYDKNFRYFHMIYVNDCSIKVIQSGTCGTLEPLEPWNLWNLWNPETSGTLEPLEP